MKVCRWPVSVLAGLVLVIAGPLQGSSFPRQIDLSHPRVPQFGMTGVSVNDAAGRSVDWAGDFNGDGYDDVIIGAFRVDGTTGGDVGAAYVVFGGPERFGSEINLDDLDGSDGLRLLGRSGGDTTGERVAGVGDVNDDGFADVAIGAYRADPSGQSGAGEVYVLFGTDGTLPASLGPDDLNGTNGFVLAGGAAFDQLGFDVAAAGDVNADGIDDLIIGGDGANAAFVVFGRSTPFAPALSVDDLAGTDGFRLSGAEPNSDAGHTVAGLGDFNGDGVDDVAVAAPASQPAGMVDAGSVFVVFGSDQPFAPEIQLGTLDGQDGFRIDGLTQGADIGHALTSLGDFDGDGLFDFALSSLRFDAPGAPNTGIVYVLFGGSAAGQPAFDLAALDGSNGGVMQGTWAEGNLGRALAAAGDFNDDGYADWMAAADRGDPESRLDAGETAVVYGSPDGVPAFRTVADLDGFSGIVVAGPTAGDRMGFDLAGGGDLDGDGRIDLLFGAPFSNAGALSDSGRAIVLSGRGLEPLFRDRFETSGP